MIISKYKRRDMILNIIICLDDKNGMLFNKRRQSCDKEIRKRIYTLVNNSKLWMNEYSKKQFTEAFNNIIVDNDFLSKACENDFCFIENVDFSDKNNDINKIFVFRWNRVYPSDVKFDAQLLKHFKLINSTDFKGNSHDKITMEEYCRA